MYEQLALHFLGAVKIAKSPSVQLYPEVDLGSGFRQGVQQRTHQIPDRECQTPKQYHGVFGGFRLVRTKA